MNVNQYERFEIRVDRNNLLLTVSLEMISRWSSP